MRFYYELNQEVATPIVATCMSRGENVQGNVGSDYSLYYIEDVEKEYLLSVLKGEA